MLLRLLTISLVVTSLFACGTTRKTQYDEVKVDTVANQDLVVAGDALWAERSDRAKLISAIGEWEKAITTGGDFETLVKLSRAHYFLADGYYALSGEVEKRDQHYTKGLDYAEKAIAVGAPEFVAAVKGGKKHREAIKMAPKEVVPALYWFSANMGKWAGSKGFATVLRYKDDIKATMDHVLAMDPSYFHGAAYRYLGAYEAKTAGLAGGSLPKSKEFFEKAVADAPGYLGTKVLFADYYATKVQDRALYKKLLEEVIAAEASVLPEVQPENIIEQKKARKLLAEIDDKF